MHFDEDGVAERAAERRMPMILVERELADLKKALTKAQEHIEGLERIVAGIPAMIEAKLREQAENLKNSRGARTDALIRFGTLGAALASAIAAIANHLK